MARTASTMKELGTNAPDFHLPDVVSGQTISLATFAAKKALLVMFICRHCPYVEHVKHELTRLGGDYAEKEVGIVAISANDPSASGRCARTAQGYGRRVGLLVSTLL